MTSLTQQNEAAVVIEQHKDWLTRLIAARCQGASSVDDLFQEVALAVIRSNDRPDTESGMKSWLCTIAIRQCALSVRKAVRQRRLLNGAAAMPTSESAELKDPLVWMLNDEQSELIRTAINRLDEQDRWLLLQKFQHKRTYSDLAEEMRVAPHKVEYQILKARKQLRSELHSLGVEGGE